MNSQLNKFSAKVATEVFSLFPEWESFASIDNTDNEKALLIKVVSPTGDKDDILTISTLREEVTVFFGAYHAHFEDLTDDDCTDDAISLIKDIINEDICIVSYWRGEQWCGSTYFSTKDKLPDSNDEQPYANLIKIRSWSGHFNNEIKCTPKS